MSRYDYIFLGAGCAGLSLATRMGKSGQFRDKRILLIDKSPRDTNDRTWCFWENKDGFFESIVYRKWNKLDFLSSNWSREMNIHPYEYKMIRGIDFYNHCLREISSHANVELVCDEVRTVSHGKDGVVIQLNNRSIAAGGATVFNSIYNPPANATNGLRLLQHFKGWVIQADTPVFAPAKATMMDFRVPQDKGTTFAYVLPFDPYTALIEYTLFTRDLLKPGEYDEGLHHYIQQLLGIDRYTVKEEEFGVIPMTNEKFPFYRDGMYHIGTAGGQTKASSGYTFQFIQKLTGQIVEHLIDGKPLRSIPGTPRRFRFYDNTLLHILYHNKLKGSDIFTTLFKKNKPQQVLRFLDNESSIAEELRIIASLPIWPFLKAALAVRRSRV
jgi:lycopene beta-cyclase